MPLKTLEIQEKFTPSQAFLDALKQVSGLKEIKKDMSSGDYLKIYPKLVSFQADMLKECNGDNRKMMLTLESICNSKGDAYKEQKDAAAFMYGFGTDLDYYIKSTNKSSDGTLLIDGPKGLKKTFKFGLKGASLDMAIMAASLEFDAHKGNYLIKSRLRAEQSGEKNLEEVNLKGKTDDQSTGKGSTKWDPELSSDSPVRTTISLMNIPMSDVSPLVPGFDAYSKGVHHLVQEFVSKPSPTWNDQKYYSDNLPGAVDAWLASPAGVLSPGKKTSQVIDQDLQKTRPDGTPNPDATVTNFRNLMASNNFPAAFALLKKDSDTYTGFGVDLIKYGTVRTFVSPAIFDQIMVNSLKVGPVLAKNIGESAAVSLYVDRNWVTTLIGDDLKYNTIGLKFIGHINFLKGDVGAGVNLVHFDNDKKLIGATRFDVFLDKRLLSLHTFYAALTGRYEYLSMFSSTAGKDLNPLPNYTGFTQEVPSRQDYSDVQIGVKAKKVFPIYSKSKGEQIMKVSIFGGASQRFSKPDFWNQLGNTSTLSANAGVGLEGIKMGPGTVQVNFSVKQTGFGTNEFYPEAAKIRPQYGVTLIYHIN